MVNISIADILLDRSVPDFIRRDPGNFELFLKTYYEYLEQTKQTLDIAKNLRNYNDIDETLDEFVEHFRYTYLQNIPENIKADKRLLVKYIKDFYLNKGNENSYKFLFKLLYDDDIEFYYPKVDILRASDGKWEEIVSIKVNTPAFPNIGVFSGAFIVGGTSSASALISLVIQKIERGVSILELQIQQVKGIFIPNEVISITYVDDQGQTHVIPNVLVREVYSNVKMTSGGSAYKVDDVFFIKDETNISIGSGNVLRITRGPVTGLNIIAGGTGYNGEQKTITDFANLPIGSTYMTDYLPNTQINGYKDDTISFPITSTTIPSIGDPIQIIDSSDSIGTGAYGTVVSTTLSGTITAVRLDNGGNSYNTPRAVVISDTGTGANIGVTGGGGSIVDVKLNDFPLKFATDGISTGLTLDFTQTGNGDATGVFNASEGTITYPGRWVNTDGFLSSDKKLQDNFYYQDFSYVLLTGVSSNRWDDIVNKIIHPAGFKNFGQINLKAEFIMDDPVIDDVLQTFFEAGYLVLVDGSRLELAEGDFLILAQA